MGLAATTVNWWIYEFTLAGGITSTELSMDYSVAVKTLGFGQVGPFLEFPTNRGLKIAASNLLASD